MLVGRRHLRRGAGRSSAGCVPHGASELARCCCLSWNLASGRGHAAGLDRSLSDMQRASDGSGETSGQCGCQYGDGAPGPWRRPVTRGRHDHAAAWPCHSTDPVGTHDCAGHGYGGRPTGHTMDRFLAVARIVLSEMGIEAGQITSSTANGSGSARHKPVPQKPAGWSWAGTIGSWPAQGDKGGHLAAG